MRHELVVTLAWVSAAAALAPLLTAALPRRVVPVIVAEIVLGIAVGPSGFGLLTPNPALDLLAGLGFALLMFVSGIEIDLRLLTRNTSAAGPRRPLLWTLPIVLATFALSFAGASWLWRGERGTAELLFLSFVLSTTSVGIVVPTLKERALTATAFGQLLLACAILADLFTMIGVSVIAAWIAGGELLRALQPLLFVLVAALGCLLLVRFGRGTATLALLRTLDTPTARWPMRAAFALLFALALLAEALQAEMVLAAFVAGIAVGAMSPRGSALRDRVEASGFGLLIPMFFFGVGVGFDLPALLASPATLAALPALLMLAYGNKIVPMLPLRGFFGTRELLGGGVLLAARLSLVIAAAAIGVRLGVLDAALNAAMILLALCTAVLSPVLFNLLAPAAAPIAAARRDDKRERPAS